MLLARINSGAPVDAPVEAASLQPVTPVMSDASHAGTVMLPRSQKSLEKLFGAAVQNSKDDYALDDNAHTLTLTRYILKKNNMPSEIENTIMSMVNTEKALKKAVIEAKNDFNLTQQQTSANILARYILIEKLTSGTAQAKLSRDALLHNSTIKERDYNASEHLMTAETLRNTIMDEVFALSRQDEFMRDMEQEDQFWEDFERRANTDPL